MKKITFAFIVLSSVMMQSCLQSKYETTPQIQLHKYISVNHTDTISAFYNTSEQKYFTDTMLVGDTMTLTVYFDAVGNNLTKGEIKFEPEYADLEIVGDETLEGVVTPNIAAGLFSFTVQEGYRAIRLVINYIPLKAGVPQLSFRVESDSEYSPASFVLFTPIKTKPAEISSDYTDVDDDTTGNQ